MKAWHIAALLLGVTVVLVFLKNSMRPAGTNNPSQGATSNDVIFGLSKFGSGLLDLGGKIFTPSSNPGVMDYGAGTSFAQGGTTEDNPSGTGNNIFDIGTG